MRGKFSTKKDSSYAERGQLPVGSGYIAAVSGYEHTKDREGMWVLLTVLSPQEHAGVVIRDKVSELTRWKLARLCREAGLEVEEEDVEYEDIVKRLLTKQVEVEVIERRGKVTAAYPEPRMFKNYQYSALPEGKREVPQEPNADANAEADASAMPSDDIPF